MARDVSVAPKERINIVYKSATSDSKEEIELPMKLLVLGDFTLQDDDSPVEDRKVVSVDKHNFNDVMEASKLNLSFMVRDALTDDDAEISVDLKFDNMKSFEPGNIVKQVPELNKLLELREALTTLKGPIGNVPAFRKLLQSIVSNEESRNNLMQELKLLEDISEDGK